MKPAKYLYGSALRIVGFKKFFIESLKYPNWSNRLPSMTWDFRSKLQSARTLYSCIPTIFRIDTSFHPADATGAEAEARQAFHQIISEAGALIFQKRLYEDLPDKAEKSLL